MPEHLHRQFPSQRRMQQPKVTRVTLTQVDYKVGEGCCEEDPVRIATAWYDDEGQIVVERDFHLDNPPIRPIVINTGDAR